MICIYQPYAMIALAGNCICMDDLVDASLVSYILLDGSLRNLAMQIYKAYLCLVPYNLNIYQLSLSKAGNRKCTSSGGRKFSSLRVTAESS